MKEVRDEAGEGGSKAADQSVGGGRVRSQGDEGCGL